MLLGLALTTVTAQKRRRMVIARRLATYHPETEPIVEHYRVSGRLVPLHAERPVLEVYAELQAALPGVYREGLEEMGLAEGTWQMLPRLNLSGPPAEDDETRVVILEPRTS